MAKELIESLRNALVDLWDHKTTVMLIQAMWANQFKQLPTSIILTPPFLIRNTPDAAIIPSYTTLVSEPHHNVAENYPAATWLFMASIALQYDKKTIAGTMVRSFSTEDFEQGDDWGQIGDAIQAMPTQIAQYACMIGRDAFPQGLCY